MEASAIRPTGMHILWGRLMGAKNIMQAKINNELEAIAVAGVLFSLVFKILIFCSFERLS
jgi:hypothetical protein